MTNRVTHFDLQASDPEELKEFYQKIFGWDFEKWDNPSMDYWMVFTDRSENSKGKPGINGGMGIKKEGQPSFNTIEVENLDEKIKKVQEAGAKIMMPKVAIPTVGWMTSFVDPQGNMFGMIQNDSEAK